MLAYLAAYKGIWGCHLIVVPTSVIMSELLSHSPKFCAMILCEIVDEYLDLLLLFFVTRTQTRLGDRNQKILPFIQSSLLLWLG